MSRKSEFQNENPNPAKYFLEWKSDLKCFQYYDKQKQESINIGLPFIFLTLKEMHTIKGWHDPSQSSIYSNEVKFIGREILNVRSFKGGPIASGFYKDIKESIRAAGGHYTKSIYIMAENGDILNIQLKGSAVQAWGDFTQKSKSRLYDEWVMVRYAEERTKGKINYSVPVFEFNQSLDEDSAKKADEVYGLLDMYMKAYLQADEETKIVEVIEENLDEEDDLPF